MSSKGIPILYIGLGIVGLVVLAALGVAGYQYVNYRAVGDSIPDMVNTTQVVIGRPAQGEIYEPPAHIVVEASATGLQPFTRMELWINGELKGSLDAPDGGVNPFPANFAWLPTSPGSFTLVARAIDADDNAFISPGVTVYIDPGDPQLAAAPGLAAAAVVPAADHSPAPPSPPDPGEPVTPAEPWQGSPGDWITNQTNGQAPAAPELAVKAGECGAALSIRDLSDNEEGFIVFRQTLNRRSWDQVAVLSSQSRGEWLTYFDDGALGGLSYYVASFNKQAISPSNIVMLDIDPTGCPTPERDGLPMVSAQLVEIIPGQPVERSYCYSSWDGLHWSRLPEKNFFVPGEDGFMLEKQADKLVFTITESEPIYEEMELKLDCWGWQGMELIHLGEVHYDTMTPGLNEAGIGKLKTRVIWDQIKNYGSDLYPMSGSWSGATWTDTSGMDTIIGPDNIPQSTRMPWINAWITYDPDDCKDHLLPENQNILGQLLSCWVYPGFNPGPGGSNPQPYLVWEANDDVCYSKIMWGIDCLPMSWWIDYAEQNNALLRFWVEDYYGGTNYAYEPIPGKTVHVIPSDDCQMLVAERTFRVFMRYDDNAGPDIVSSKAHVTLPCTQTDMVYVDVAFETIELHEVDDGEDDPQDIEVYGNFSVSNPISSYLHVSTGSEVYTNCDSEAFSGVLPEGGLSGLGCHRTLLNDTYDIADFEICKASTLNTNPSCYTTGVDFIPNNNHILVPVTAPGGNIIMGVSLTDYDSASANDNACSAVVSTDWHTLSIMGMLNDETYTIYSPDNGNADCTVVVKLNAVPEP